MQTKLILFFIFLLTISTSCSKPEPPTINLYRAVHIGDIDQVERNLYWGTDVDQLGADGLSALHVAAGKGSLVMVKKLLEHGADKEIQDRQGDTPVARAILNRHTLVADYLVKQGARLDPDALLRKAVLLGQADRDVIDFLAGRGALLDKTDAAGNAPLHLAILHGQRVIAKYLVQKGADIDLVDGSGRTPLQLAIELENKDIERMLRKFGATPGSSE